MRVWGSREPVRSSDFTAEYRADLCDPVPRRAVRPGRASWEVGGTSCVWEDGGVGEVMARRDFRGFFPQLQVA